MATGNFYRGTSQSQDARFSNKDKKLLNSREWPPEFDLKVNMKKVELSAIKPWIAKRITEILGFEDEVVQNLAVSELESTDERGPCPKKIQLNLTGFLSNKAGVFMKELWKLLLEAQDSPNGIPFSLVEERKEEIKQKKEELQSQEAKLESIRAFLKQAGEEIKSKLGKKGPESLSVPGGTSEAKKGQETGSRPSKKRSRSRSSHRKKSKRSKEKESRREREKRREKEHRSRKVEKKPVNLSSGSDESGNSSEESSGISEASSD